MFTVLVCALSMVLLIGAVVALALRQEYLVVLRWARVSSIYLERDAGGRYRPISRAELPLALLRFVRVQLSLAVAASRRAANRAGLHLPAVVSGKV